MSEPPQPFGLSPVDRPPPRGPAKDCPNLCCVVQAADKLQEDTNEAKNALEAYIYSLRNKLYESLAPYVKEADKEALVAQLTRMEDWLYDEGGCTPAWI